MALQLAYMSPSLTFTFHHQSVAQTATRRGDLLLFTCRDHKSAAHLADALNEALPKAVQKLAGKLETGEAPIAVAERNGVKLRPISELLAALALSELPFLQDIRIEHGHTPFLAKPGLARAEASHATRALGFFNAQVAVVQVIAREEFDKIHPSARMVRE